MPSPRKRYRHSCQNARSGRRQEMGHYPTLATVIVIFRIVLRIGIRRRLVPERVLGDGLKDAVCVPFAAVFASALSDGAHRPMGGARRLWSAWGDPSSGAMHSPDSTHPVWIAAGDSADETREPTNGAHRPSDRAVPSKCGPTDSLDSAGECLGVGKCPAAWREDAMGHARRSERKPHPLPFIRWSGRRGRSALFAPCGVTK